VFRRRQINVSSGNGAASKARIDSGDRKSTSPDKKRS
jgi:hypothetical protein